MLGEAFKRASGRLQGVIEAAKRGDLSYVPATTAGTDVDGPELADRIDAFTRSQAEDLGLDRGAVRALNGTALTWFWVGWEAGREEDLF